MERLLAVLPGGLGFRGKTKEREVMGSLGPSGLISSTTVVLSKIKLLTRACCLITSGITKLNAGQNSYNTHNLRL